MHVFSLDFLERMAGAASLPYHIAEKRVPYVDPWLGEVKPFRPNALKFERFIFDLLPLASNPILVEVDAAEHFAPLKNAPGQAADTPEAVRAQMVDLHTRWLLQAGATVAPGVPVEISPLFALDAAELARRLAPGAAVTSPTYFRP